MNQHLQKLALEPANLHFWVLHFFVCFVAKPAKQFGLWGGVAIGELLDVVPDKVALHSLSFSYLECVIGAAMHTTSKYTTNWLHVAGCTLQVESSRLKIEVEAEIEVEVEGWAVRTAAATE